MLRLAAPILAFLVSCATPAGPRLVLGAATRVTRGTTYVVEGTDLTVTVVGAALAAGQDARGRDTETLRLSLAIAGGGGPRTELELAGDAPAMVRGYSLRADADGFEFSGPGAGTLTVSR